MPLGPGVDLLDVGARAWRTSSSVMGGTSQVGSGAGSSGLEGSTGVAEEGKKRVARATSISEWTHVVVPSGVHRGWTEEDLQPWCQRVAVHRSWPAIWKRKSLPHARLAARTVMCRAFAASLQARP